MQKISTVGVIGLGAFGTFAASLVPKHVALLGYDTAERKIPNVTPASLKDVCQANVVVMAVPLSAYKETLLEVKKYLPASSLLVDICSVKVVPEKLIKELLPNHKNLLITHPLFGPQSASNSTVGHTLVVCGSSGETSEIILNFCKQELRLNLVTMSAEQHDKEMALIHALTFFVARGLNKMQTPPVHFKTPSYTLIQNLIDFDESHSDELFQTIQNGNPYAQETREKFIKMLFESDQSLKKLKSFDQLQDQ